MLRDQRSFTILYRASTEAESHEFPLDRVQQWYELSAIPISARFSFDRGTTWESIIELRRRNGPAFPFIPKSENGEIEEGLGSIEVMSKMISALRTEVVRLEVMKEELEQGVEEQEKMLEKMREMEKELLRQDAANREKRAKAEARTITGPSSEQKENRQDAEKGLTKREVADAPSVNDTAASGITKSSPASVPRPRLFPLLQSSTVPSDFSADASLMQLRASLQKGISPVARSATWDTFDPPPKCSLCVGVQQLSDLSSFLEHVLSTEHLNKISSSGGKISAAQCYFWLDILQKGCTNRSPV